ncbi:bifunctional glycoside hydrolase 114/ polysaccharide deacetylase family protein [Pseudomonas sp. F1_0610]|uniref:endo alpha-1,4 polygalactosaminidase n=1 Tax=Pseudomonas sp. F1_0610 TaxID=3114284 RepID=UPI0039C2016A
MDNQLPYFASARLWLVTFLSFFSSFACANTAKAVDPDTSIVFWYADNPPLSELSQFDWLVLESAHFDAPAREFLRSQKSSLFAYLSVGEFDGNRKDLANAGLSKSTANQKNHAWDSHVMNLADTKWQDYLVKRAKALHADGYDGLFLDTLDSFQLLPKKQQEAQRLGLVQILTKLQTQVPEVKLIFNRGFEVIDDLPKQPTAVAIESIYAGWEPGANRYREVSKMDREWLEERLQPLREANIPLIAIDYLPPERREEARLLVKKLRSEGFIPYIGTPHLDSLGISTIEVQPRRLALIFDEREGDLTMSTGHVALGGLLEYLGYRVDYFPVDKPLPQGSMSGIYAGVITWMTSGSPLTADVFYKWLNQRLDEQMPIVFLGGVPVENDVLLERLGLRLRTSTVSQKLDITSYDKALLGHFEAPIRVRSRDLPPLISTNKEHKIALKLTDPLGKEYHPVLLTSWGGVALNPYLLESAMDNSRWVLDPFAFLQQSLNLAHQPRPDSTTENGRRIATVHIDGDGFPSKAEIPGTPYAGQSVLDLFIKPYPLLTSVSVIEGEVGPKGKYPNLSPTFEKIAREIFALDKVEVASHTFSHPFFWRPEIAQQKEDFDPEYGYMMDIPGYDTVDYTREVIGSIDYINERLTTPEKPVKAIFWSGDALPSEETIKLAYDKGVMNINGAVTAVKPSNPSVTGVHPLLRPTQHGMHYYAPIINENVYTNLWHGPYYGFRDLIFTLQFTDKPRRMRGMHLYYHFYSGTKQASIKVMRDIYRHILDAQPFSLWITDYIPRLHGLHQASLAKRADGSWQIKGMDKLRTVRIDPEMGWPNLTKSTHIAGVRNLEQGRYIALSSDQAVLHLQAQRDTAPSLEQANIPLTAWNYLDHKSVSFAFDGFFNLNFAVRYNGSCSVQVNGKRFSGVRNQDVTTFNIPMKQVHNAKLICQ